MQESRGSPTGGAAIVPCVRDGVCPPPCIFNIDSRRRDGARAVRIKRGTRRGSKAAPKTAAAKFGFPRSARLSMECRRGRLGMPRERPAPDPYRTEMAQGRSSARPLCFLFSPFFSLMFFLLPAVLARGEDKTAYARAAGRGSPSMDRLLCMKTAAQAPYIRRLQRGHPFLDGTGALSLLAVCLRSRRVASVCLRACACAAAPAQVTVPLRLRQGSQRHASCRLPDSFISAILEMLVTCVVLTVVYFQRTIS